MIFFVKPVPLVLLAFYFVHYLRFYMENLTLFCSELPYDTNLGTSVNRGSST